VLQQPIKTEATSLQASFTSTWGIPQVAGPPRGPPGVSKPYPLVRDLVHPMALTERLVGISSNRDRSTTLMSDSPAYPFSQAGRASLQDGSKTPAQGPFPGRVNVHGIHAMDDNRGSILEAAPSKPRAMLIPAPVKVEKSKPTSGTEPRTSLTPLTRNDLEKWPCRRCHFVHRGGECETSCIGCGSRRHDKHALVCPFKKKVRQEDHPQVPMKRETMSLHEPPSRFKPIDPHISATMQLSLECQRRGFNPEFKYYRGRDEGDNRADLWIKDVLISGGGISYKSQKDARDALAPKGLEVVRKMGYGLVPGGFEAGKIMSATSHRSVPNAGSTSIRSPLSALRSSSRSRSFPARQPEKRASLTEIGDPVMDLIKSALSPLQWKERPANTIANTTPTESKRLESSHQTVAKSGVVVELPANIESHAARATVERVVAANPQTNISLHFPANVSVEIAQAYGLAISAMAISSRRRSRTRSPVRDVERDYRERDRDRDRDRCRDYRERERDLHHSRSSSVWTPRNSIDAYRPSPHAVPRNRIENSRLRLSPPPESKYYPPHDRRDRYSRDERARR
jgi:hypothetical protein